MSDFAQSGKADSPLAALAAQLVAAREAAALAEDAYAEAINEWLESIGGPYLRAKQTTRQEVGDLDTAVRAAMLAQIADIEREQEAVPGLGIRWVNKLTYDESEATDWCRVNFPAALRLDRKLFEELAKVARPPLPFVTHYKEPQTTIATDLGAKLRSASEPSRAEARAMVDADRRAHGQRVADEIAAATRGNDGAE